MKYGKVIVTVLPFEVSIVRLKALLGVEGFGVLCDIDVSKTLHEKIHAEFRPYRILGACNPDFAQRALEQEPHLGLLLPCNLVVQELGGSTVVSAIDAGALMGVVGRPELSELAQEVNTRLGRILDSLAVAAA